MANLHPSKLNVGDVFYECEMGVNIEARVTTKPEVVSKYEDRLDQWAWKAENTQTGEVIDYLLTDDLSHYGPRLYDQPQYGYVRDGEWRTPLVGQNT